MGTKTCSSCKEIKSTQDFYLWSKNKTATMPSCKACHNSKVKAYRSKPATNYNARNRARRVELKQRAVAYKGGICQDCNISYPYYVYDFHHDDLSLKEEHIDKVIRRSKFEDVVKELDKCVLLCSNCHRTRHWSKYSDEGMECCP